MHAGEHMAARLWVKAFHSRGDARLARMQASLWVRGGVAGSTGSAAGTRSDSALQAQQRSAHCACGPFAWMAARRQQLLGAVTRMAAVMHANPCSPGCVTSCTGHGLLLPAVTQLGAKYIKRWAAGVPLLCPLQWMVHHKSYPLMS